MLSKPELSNIEIIPIRPRDGHIAFCNLVVDGSLYLSSIGLHSSPNSRFGYRLVFPDKILANGKRIQLFHPINSTTNDVMLEQIVDKYEEVMFKKSPIQQTTDDVSLKFCAENRFRGVPTPSHKYSPSLTTQ